MVTQLSTSLGRVLQIIELFSLRVDRRFVLSMHFQLLRWKMRRWNSHCVQRSTDRDPFHCNPARADLHFHPASIDLNHRAVALLSPEMSRSYSGMVTVAEVAKRLQVHINGICSSCSRAQVIEHVQYGKHMADRDEGDRIIAIFFGTS